ncbi:MAG: hypothetical protein J0I41_08710 [Filimonas sp.]|nr:hypothetical protein [Filimonas sp.]
MKKILVLSMLAIVVAAGRIHAQSTTITSNNSWLKVGANVGVPVGNASNYSNFTLGLDVKGQVLETSHIGLGIATGYNHYFAKDGFKDFGTIPLGAFIRVYPASKGFFAGVDGGYSFVTGYDNAKGGAYIKPQIGYHNYDWNIFGYYSNVFRSDANGGGIGSIGVGATYNIRFGKK